MDHEEARTRRQARLRTPNDLGENTTKDLSGALTTLLADTYALYLKNFHWPRNARSLRDERSDVATASLLEVWIDEAERRAWFLFEASRPGETPGL